MMALSSVVAVTQAPQQKETQTVVISVPKQIPKPGEPTVEQFREYLQLSGVGEAWRAHWIAALDPNWKRVAAPYWPLSMEDDMQSEMRKTDLAPTVWSVYHVYFSKQTLSDVNALLRDKGISGYLASPLGGSFCREWALHEDEWEHQTLSLTTEVLSRVYERDKPLVKAARAEYLKTHPDYKD